MDYERLIVLLRKLKQEKMQFFDEFYEMTKKQVFYAAFAIVRDHHLAEDMMQDAYLMFLKNVKKVKEDKTILAYLMQIAKNLSLNYIKKHKKSTHVEDDAVFDYASDKVETHNDTLYAMQQLLSQEEFEIVIKHVIMKLTHREIAEDLNKPLGTITWAYNNAIKKLKEALGND